MRPSVSKKTNCTSCINSSTPVCMSVVFEGCVCVVLCCRLVGQPMEKEGDDDEWL